MWFKLLLCFVVALAHADHNKAWQHNYEYVYQVRGRLLTGLNQISNKYSGLLIKGELAIRPRPDGHLMAKLSNTQYADIHASLYEEWQQDIPDSELSYKQLQISSKPFKIMLESGVIYDIVVDKSMSNWQANIIKGIVSQLQLDTDGENHIRSSINIFTQQGSNTAVFKTMEQTVTGEAETLYEIHPFPEYVLKTDPWAAPMEHEGELIEVIKSKNFTHSKQRPSYHFGFQGANKYDLTNTVGEFFSRTSVTRAVLSGDLDQFTIQSAVTVEEVTINPALKDKQRGLTGTIVNITLNSMQPKDEQFEEVSNTVHVGIVYQYDHPFGESNEPRTLSAGRRNENSDSSSGSSENKIYAERKPRDHETAFAEDASSESGGDLDPEYYTRTQDKPRLEEAPASPLLPLTVGFDGQAISMKLNVPENVRMLAKKIGEEYQDPENIPEQGTAGKFLLLTSLIKVMTYNQTARVSKQLYTEEKHGAAAAAWVAYRDGVAQAGTGPSLLTIEEWIANNQVSNFEAAELITATLASARQPTEKYMQFVFKMIQNDQYMAQEHLNQSLVLSFTRLVGQVYVNEEDSHDKFPVHSFGTFNTVQGRLFVKKEVIPYLSTKLNQAISQGNTRRIHLYIRALGNIGHQQILLAFQPYLEGSRKASQFQRVLMVMAMEKLVLNNPKVARSVLYKIYQNPKDFEQVRVTAVFQLMRTDPSPSMLQRMARYTNIDSNNHVNAAVKSAIKAAAKLQVPRLAKLRAAAQSAEPLLTPEKFGMQSSKMFLSNYIVEQMQLEAKQVIETWGGEDCVWPKGLHYFLRGRFGGIKQPVVDLKAMVSSIEDLINVGEQQTRSYRQSLKEKQSYESVKTKWSSENTAKLLNMQNEQREQLEGYIHIHLAAMQKVWSFDNQTMEQAAKDIEQLEKDLRNGHQIDYSKMAVHPEGAVSFPTAWGLPFLYTYDRPTLMHFQVTVKGQTKPSLYSEGGIRTPETLDLEYELHGFASGRSQTQFGVFTPFNNRRYTAGYDKNFQMVVPQIKGKLHYNVENQQATLELQNTDKRRNTNLLHFSTWPYTSQYEINTQNPQTEVIRKQDPQKINAVVGDKATGIALAMKMTSDQRIDFGYLYDQLEGKKVDSALLSSWPDDNIDHMELNVALDSSKSTTNKVTIQLGHQELYFPGLQKNRKYLDRINHPNPLAKESWERQNEFLKNSTSGISNVHARVVDAIALFEGQKQIKYTATVGGSRSNIDPTGRLLMQAVKYGHQQQPIKYSFQAESKVPNPPSLNLESALNFDPTSTVDIEVGIEGHQPQHSQLNVNVKMTKSENRKQHLKEHPQYSLCKEQMGQGNNQLPACSILTTQANLLDRFSTKVDYRNIDPETVNATYKAYSMLRQLLYPRISEDILSKSQPNQLTIEGEFHADLTFFNASITTEKLRAEIKNVPVHSWSRSFLVPHPVHRVTTRAKGSAMKNPEYEAKCVIDKTAINTLDNRTYPAEVSKDWVVALHYLPRRPSPLKNKPELTVIEQLNQHLEGYILYVRTNEKDASQKEIKLVIQSPNTLGKVIDVTLRPGTDYPRLFIQNEQIIYDDQGSHIYDDYMQVYKLPNNEIKMEVYDSFTVVYDGTRAKITVINDKFRDSSRGLCGTFTGEEETDFTHPGNCIIRSPEVFVSSNIVPVSHRNKRMNDMLMIQAEEKKCYQKSVGYVKVISTKDSGITGNDRYTTRSSKMEQLLRYVEDGDDVCFSLRPVPTCKPSFVAQRSERLQVPVHCVKNSRLAQAWMRNIDLKSSPSFQHKSVSKSVTMEVPEHCG